MLRKDESITGYEYREQISYKPFGEVKDRLYCTGSTDADTRLKYIGKQMDYETNLADHGVRKYDNALGQFTSIDPLWEKYYGWTPYHYTGNNPMSRTDGNGFGFNPPQAQIVNNSNQPITIVGSGGFDRDEIPFTFTAEIKPGEKYMQSVESISEGKSFYGGIITDGKNTRNVNIYDVDAIVIKDNQKFVDENCQIRTNENTKNIAGGHIKIGGTFGGQLAVRLGSSTENDDTITISNCKCSSALTISVTGVMPFLSPSITFGELKK